MQPSEIVPSSVSFTPSLTWKEGRMGRRGGGRKEGRALILVQKWEPTHHMLRIARVCGSKQGNEPAVGNVKKKAQQEQLGVTFRRCTNKSFLLRKKHKCQTF